jgi:hypothetical protein
MPHVSLTRLRLRSPRYLLPFALLTQRVLRQVRRSPGFLSGQVVRVSWDTFWTMTVWDSADAARGFMTSGAHLQAMPRLLHWCNEGSVAHWAAPSADVPSWEFAHHQMRTIGRVSKVRFPSANHVSLTFPAPNPVRALPIRPDSGVRLA